MLKVDLKKLKLLRKNRMSLEEMSTRLGYDSPNGYYYLESGRSKIPADVLAKVSVILDVPIQELFIDDENQDEK
ncbi:helix-turn-helix domain-containing protein [Sporolactobacillus vineae]|uniref:helix-turn-helix domain-containing protein n=1 Tax=Sporolactobacillus vineae TaxID=444463 RepID=UPI000288CA42|nr:helix-turn-helix transcriptional regulator [Sporolactobacillus vineae]